MKKTKFLISTLALLSLVSFGACYAIGKSETYTIKTYTKKDWRGGPKSEFKQCPDNKMFSKWEGKSFSMDKLGRLVGTQGPSKLEYVASMKLHKNVYNTVWHLSDHTLLSSTCVRGQINRVRRCTVIYVNEDRHCYKTAELVPTKKS